MIKINLLPTKRKKKPTPVPMFIVAMAFLVVFAVIASGYAVYFLNSKIKDLEAQKRANQNKIAELNKKIEEVKGFEQRNKVFMERKKIIEELTMNQSLPVRVLDEISRRLTDGIWLDALKISRGGISISGDGFSNSDIVTYVQSLKGSSLFTNVVLLGTTRTEISGVTVYKFNINFDLSVQNG